MATGPSTAWFMGFSTGAAKPEKAKPGAARRALCLDPVLPWHPHLSPVSTFSLDWPRCHHLAGLGKNKQTNKKTLQNGKMQAANFYTCSFSG